MTVEKNREACSFRLRAVRDALEVIQGKWRLPIVISLSYGEKRFGEISRDIPEASPKMLSQELKALEENKIITRTLYNTMPVKVEYSLTPLGSSMTKLLDELLNWGIHFREAILQQ